MLTRKPLGHGAAHRAYTLVEILVVLAIGTFVSAMTIGGFGSIREGNKRTSCQANLAQIYAAARLYSQDYREYPYYNPSIATGPSAPTGGIGLWALYTFPDPSDPDLPARGDSGLPRNLYLRNLTSFHCPDDDYTRNGNRSSVDYLASHVINPDFNSYQVQDDVFNGATYSLFRGDGVKRQLDYFDGAPAVRRPFPTPDTTIVTWCRFHRRLNRNGETQGGDRNFDNVLFADGTVQLIPASQSVTYKNGNPATCTGWRRFPREMAGAVPDNSCP